MTTTNIIRLQLSANPCHQYEAFSSIPLSAEDPQQVKHFLEQLDNNLIYDHPFLFANNKITADRVFIILSRGCTTQLSFSYLGELEKSRALPQICNKLLTSFQFLNCWQVNACFNPFEEKDSTMPGLSIEPAISEQFVGLALLPINLVTEPAQQISNAKMLLNYSKGKFYQRRQIVRFDKANKQVHFLNGQIISQTALKKAKLKNVTGFALAERLSNYIQRIKDNCKQFLENWGIQLDSRFLSRSSSMIPPGSITFKGMQKQLNDFIFPMARNTYNHYYRLAFKDVSFQENLTAEIYVFLPENLKKSGKVLVKDIQKIAERMQLKVSVFRIDFDSFQKREDLIKLIENNCRKQGPIYAFIAPVQPTKVEQDNIDFLKQEMINRSLHFHFIDFDPADQADETDIIALRHLSILYPKERLHPWILGQIPFGDKPTIACNVNVQQTLSGQFSVALVFTMNKFFSRFKSMREICVQQNIGNTVFSLLKKALQTFQSKFNVIPFRIFLYRTGKVSQRPEKQFQSVKFLLGQFNVEARNKNICVLTYILLNKSHSFRTYTQTDDNYINYQTVKKTQLLSTMVHFQNIKEISNKKYVQLEFDEPPMEITILDRENDPTFVPKVLELTVKLCYGSVGNGFGKGMGFLDFAVKLNSFRNFDLTNWQMLLMEGYMLFL